MIDPRDITVRYFELEDLNDFCDYWYRSPPGFWEGRAFLHSSLPKEEEMRERWVKRINEREQNPFPIVTVFYRGERVGIHSSTHYVPNENLIMHAHFFFEKFRGKGIGTISYVKAMERFLIDFGLKEVLFKTPVKNLGPMRIKEKLGLQSIGEEILDWPQLLPGTRAKVFRVTLDDVRAIKLRLKID